MEYIVEAEYLRLHDYNTTKQKGNASFVRILLTKVCINLQIITILTKESKHFQK